MLKCCIFFVDTNEGEQMRARIQKWGNSLALRIPKAFAAEVQLEQDSLVDITLSDGAIVVSPVSEESYTLEQLLAGVTKNNIHREVDTGSPMGNEVW
jgi:antitoxin MazE